MILVEQNKFKKFEWDYILNLHNLYANNENIGLLLNGHFIGYSKWEVNDILFSHNIFLKLNDYSCIAINLSQEAYSIFYKEKKIAGGLLTLKNLKEAALIFYQYYAQELQDDKNNELGINHPFYKAILSSSLAYIY